MVVKTGPKTRQSRSRLICLRLLTCNSGKGDLVGPTGLRSLCNIDAVRVITGPSANYAVVLDREPIQQLGGSHKADWHLGFGAAYLFGAFPAVGYGNKGMIPDQNPVKISPALVGSGSSDARFVTGACARSHCLLVDDNGEVWGCGVNVTGQLGMASPIQSLVVLRVFSADRQHSPCLQVSMSLHAYRVLGPKILMPVSSRSRPVMALRCSSQTRGRSTRQGQANVASWAMAGPVGAVYAECRS